uniref:Protein FAM33A n=1 Tax=Catharus ustulatus TaxID=91951 RepID=A0A8C3Y441_CATUS
MKSFPDGTEAEVVFSESPAALLKELPLLKSRYKSLCAQMEAISLEQKESMESIRAALEKTMSIVQELQQQTGLEVEFSF